MLIKLSTSDIEALRRLQRNLAGSFGYARVTCILALGKGNSPSFLADCLGIYVPTAYRYMNAYPPSINLIERLWTFLREKVIITGFYRTEKKFRNTIKFFFEHIGSFKKDLEALLTLKFRLINS